ncbi:MAG TPA: DUF2723 domain-containing protein [Vicinamibacterales bacterium]
MSAPSLTLNVVDSPARRLLAAALVSACVFALYRATLLPGVDFGDTGSFQATVGSPIISPRDGYPLYFAIGSLFLHATHSEPAHALNLASAVEGALASGAIVLAAAELSGSVTAAIPAALVFAGSYTFWSQAIIAEVYALHALLVSASLLLLLRWQVKPTMSRLTAFFAVYALGFGNHLSMVLLLPGYALFLLIAAPGGWRSIVRPRVVILATTIAALGALQYTWNLRELWLRPHVPNGLFDALSIFWFDVTKSDWRETMVARVPQSMLSARVAMYAFDLRQQFGWPIPLLAVVGLVAVWRRSWRRGVLMLTLYLVNVLFAFSYNVGDTHVFYVPSHLFIAMLVAPALTLIAEIASQGRRRAGIRIAVVTAAIVYAAARVYQDYPALDRSNDRRPTAVLSALTSGLEDRQAILLTDLNWQIQNGLSYYTKAIRPEIADARMPDVLLYAPALIRDNHANGREVALTERARAELAATYGPLLPTMRDARVTAPTISEIVAGLSPRTRYVLTVLKPSRDLAPNEPALEAVVHALGGRIDEQRGDYVAIAGLAGQAPVLMVDSASPFRRTIDLDNVRVDVRMESWLDFDTIRRMGFGHVIAGREHTLIVERGVSFVAFDANGRAVQTAYAANIFAPQHRYLVQPSP